MDVSMSVTDSYWFLLKDLSNEIKLDLIARLSNSMKRKAETKPVSASKFYGIWEDKNLADADAIITDIKANRQFKDDIIAF